MSAAIRVVNLGLRFGLELCALAALGVWGWGAASALPVRLLLALGAPVVAAAVWGAFVAPRASIPVPLPVWLLLQLIIFGLASAGLLAAGYPRLAVTLAVAVLANGLMLYLTR